MTYDAMGSLTVDGPLSGTADTTPFRYDAARRRTATISPDPDGPSTGSGQADEPLVRYNHASTGTVRRFRHADERGSEAAVTQENDTDTLSNVVECALGRAARLQSMCFRPTRR